MFVCSLGTNHVGLVATWACHRLCGLQRTKLYYDRNSGYWSLFGPWWRQDWTFSRDGQRWATANPGSAFHFHLNKSHHATTHGLLPWWFCEKTPFPLTAEGISNICPIDDFTHPKPLFPIHPPGACGWLACEPDKTLQLFPQNLFGKKTFYSPLIPFPAQRDYI